MLFDFSNKKGLEMKNQNYQDRLKLLNSRINSKLESIFTTQGWAISSEVFQDIQKVIMLVNERDKTWREEVTPILTEAFNQTRKNLPDWNPFDEESQRTEQRQNKTASIISESEEETDV